MAKPMMRAIVTGGVGAIGSAIVEQLHAAGFEVVATHVGQQQQATELLERLGDNAHAVECDSCDPQAVEKLHQQYPCEILVHCAGVAIDATIWNQSISDFDKVIAVNLRGAWLHTHHAAPAMRDKKFGRVVYIGSINGSRGKFGQSAYASAKAGLHGLMKSAAIELGRRSITVNLVEPGWIDTPMTLSLDDKFRQQAIDESLLKQLGTPSDIAAAVRFLCSKDAKQITANVLRVDGGQIV